jgi:hypothetical protein
MTPGRRGWIVLFIFALYGIAMLLSARSAKAEHPAEHQAIHERFYSTWQMPDAPHVSCCHEQDCAPAQSRFVNDHWEARWADNDEWVPIPPGKVERDRDTPDGRSHMCGRRSGVRGAVTVFCFIRGGGA